MQRARSSLRITLPLLQELRLLFESATGAMLPSGYPDAGFNCFAKAFACVYLARLQGIAADHCSGEGLLLWKRSPEDFLRHLNPHAWAGVRPAAVIDLSVNGFGGRDYFTTGHFPADGVRAVPSIVTAVPAEFAVILERLGTLRPGAYLFYLVRAVRPFRFDDIERGPVAIKSPPTRQLAARYRKDILAKVVLHLHGLVTGDTRPLRGTQTEAWEQLAEWKVDALSRLEIIWRLAWRGRTAPPRDALETASWQAQWADVRTGTADG